MADEHDLDRTVTRFLRRDAEGPGAFAGAVVRVVRGDDVLLEGTWGAAELFDERLRVLPHPRPMRSDTVFDLASVTKVAATTLAVAALAGEGALSPEDPVERFVPEAAGTWLGRVSLEQLLRHQSGLPDWLPFYLLVDVEQPAEARRAEALCLIAQLGATSKPGPPDVYSDLNFIVLGSIVERAAGQALERFVGERLYEPLGLRTVGFNPPAAWRERTAATSIGNPFEAEMCRNRRFPLPLRRQPEDLVDFRQPRVLVGRANDGNCRIAFGGVSGHAGLFADAAALSAIGRMVLEEGAGGGGRAVVQAATMRRFTRGLLGWRRLTWSPAPGAFGHTGFTGTLLHLDPQRRIVVVVLTNRVHGPLPYVPAETFLRPIVEAVYAGL